MRLCLHKRAIFTYWHAEHRRRNEMHVLPHFMEVWGVWGLWKLRSNGTIRLHQWVAKDTFDTHIFIWILLQMSILKCKMTRMVCFLQVNGIYESPCSFSWAKEKTCLNHALCQTSCHPFYHIRLPVYEYIPVVLIYNIHCRKWLYIAENDQNALQKYHV